MSVLRRAAVTAGAALSGRLGARLGLGGFLSRGFPKPLGGCWLGETALSGEAGREGSSRVTLGPGGSRQRLRARV